MMLRPYPAAAADDAPERLAGPECLGRSVLVAPGQPAPPPWGSAPRVGVGEVPDRAVGIELRRAWCERRRLVIELEGPVPDPSVVIGKPWWEFKHSLTVNEEVWHHLLTANAVDARDPGRPRFLPRERALALGAVEPGRGRPGDAVVGAVGPVWCDGGPFDVFPRGSLGGVRMLCAVDLNAGRLAPLRSPRHPPAERVLMEATASASPAAAGDSPTAGAGRSADGGSPPAELAPDQRRAVEHLGGAACIVAPAGSGKTRVLTERARHLVSRLGVTASAVALVAFNVRARAEMEARTSDLDGLQVRTLNSLALAICNGSGRFARPERHGRVEVIEEREVRGILGGLVPKKRRRAMSDPLAPWIEALGAARLGLRGLEEVEKDYAPDVTGFAEVAPAYTDELDRRGLVDFDQQIIRAVEVLLTDVRARAAAREACGLLLVDEFQDLTPAHLLMLRLLAGPRADVFGVGDDDQTIYGYTGASPEWLIDYGRYFPGAVQHLLNVNYRCPAEVVEAAVNLLSHNRLRVQKSIQPAPGGRVGAADGADSVSAGSSAAVGGLGGAGASDVASGYRRPGSGGSRVSGLQDGSAAVGTHSGGAERVAARVVTLADRGVELSDIAVLTRVNSTLLAPQLVLRRLGLQCMSPVGPWFLKRTGVAAVLAWLRLATARTPMLPRDALMTAARRPPRGISPRVVQWIGEQPDLRSLRALAGRLSFKHERTARRINGLADDIARLAGCAGRGADTVGILEEVRDMGMGEVLEERLDASRRSVDRSAHGDDLRALLAVARFHADPAGFEDWLARQLAPEQGAPGLPGQRVAAAHADASESETGSPGWGRSAASSGWGDGVALATVHRVKGMEWPHVVVFGASEGLMPHRLSGDTEEERRVFHVAVTRCSESLRIITDGKASPYLGELRRRAPRPRTVGEAEAEGPSSAPGPRATSHGAGLDAGSSSAGRGGPAGGAGRAGAERVKTPPDADLSAGEKEIYERLRQWRLERSRADGSPAFTVFGNRVMAELARRRPKTDDELLRVPGIGPHKLKAYGAELRGLFADYDL